MAERFTIREQIEKFKEVVTTTLEVDYPREVVLARKEAEDFNAKLQKKVHD